MFASIVWLGKKPIQLEPKNQSEEEMPAQLAVWACVVAVDAAKSAIVASNLHEINLPPKCAGDVTPRRGPWTTVDAVRIP